MKKLIVLLLILTLLTPATVQAGWWEDFVHFFSTLFAISGELPSNAVCVDAIPTTQAGTYTCPNDYCTVVINTQCSCGLARYGIPVYTKNDIIKTGSGQCINVWSVSAQVTTTTKTTTTISDSYSQCTNYPNCHSCSSDSGCPSYPFQYCKNSQCFTDKPDGYSCSSNNECSNTNCQNGICGACRTIGQSCTSTQQCCGGNCVSGICTAFPVTTTVGVTTTIGVCNKLECTDKNNNKVCVDCCPEGYKTRGTIISSCSNDNCCSSLTCQGDFQDKYCQYFTPTTTTTVPGQTTTTVPSQCIDGNKQARLPTLCTESNYVQKASDSCCSKEVCADDWTCKGWTPCWDVIPGYCNKNGCCEKDENKNCVDCTGGLNCQYTVPYIDYKWNSNYVYIKVENPDSSNCKFSGVVKYEIRKKTGLAFDPHCTLDGTCDGNNHIYSENIVIGDYQEIKKEFKPSDTGDYHFDVWYNDKYVGKTEDVNLGEGGVTACGKAGDECCYPNGDDILHQSCGGALTCLFHPQAKNCCVEGLVCCEYKCVASKELVVTDSYFTNEKGEKTTEANENDKVNMVAEFSNSVTGHTIKLEPIHERNIVFGWLGHIDDHLSKVTSICSGNICSGSFTPTAEGTYHFDIWQDDKKIDKTTREALTVYKSGISGIIDKILRFLGLEDMGGWAIIIIVVIILIVMGFLFLLPTILPPIMMMKKLVGKK